MDLKSINFLAKEDNSVCSNEKVNKINLLTMKDTNFKIGSNKENNMLNTLSKKDILAIEIKDISKVDEYEKKNLTLNNETNFIKFIKLFKQNNQIFFAFEKPKVYLLEYLNSETLEDWLLISFYRQSIEIILKLRKCPEVNFDFFNANIFFVELEKDISSKKHISPIIKILYHGKKIFICFF
jgi:hypothetical protein